MGSPNWTGDKLGLAQLDMEGANCLQPSCAGVGAETCPAAEAMKGDLWVRSFGEWQGTQLLWAAHLLRSWHWLELGPQGLMKDCQRQSNPNKEAFLIKLLYFYQMC